MMKRWMRMALWITVLLGGCAADVLTDDIEGAELEADFVGKADSGGEGSASAAFTQGVSLCDQAALHLTECTGETSSWDVCSGEAYDEARLVLSLDCDDLATGVRHAALPLCQSLGHGCDDAGMCGASPLSADDVRQLLELSDPDTLRNVADIHPSVDGIADVFAAREDPRGLFTVVYEPITADATRLYDEHAFTHNEWAGHLIVDFASRYAQNLRAHLLGERPTLEWSRYYDLASNCSVSRLRVAVTGILVHLVVDLPYTLQTIDVERRHHADYMAFGEALVDVTPQVISNLWTYYGVDAEDFLNGFFLGRWVDNRFGDDTTTRFLFQTIRVKAWRNGLMLRSWWSRGIAFTEILTSFYALDGILATLDHTNTI